MPQIDKPKTERVIEPVPQPLANVGDAITYFDFDLKANRWVVVSEPIKESVWTGDEWVHRTKDPAWQFPDRMRGCDCDAAECARLNREAGGNAAEIARLQAALAVREKELGARDRAGARACHAILGGNGEWMTVESDKEWSDRVEKAHAEIEREEGETDGGR